MAKYIFPENFLWGAATASYQIEGSPTADGKGESIWDRFTHTPGNILDEETGDIACDHYRRYEEDVKLMADIGLNAYRFSIAWPRIFPQGGGRPNLKGLDFYRRLVDELHRHNIKPAVTLYHWDLPQALQDKGGWNNRDTARYFAEYAAYLYDSLDLPIDRWITINEPWVITFLGHAFNPFSTHAPGIDDFNVALQVSHNLLLGHGLAVQSFRESGRNGEPIGITLNLQPFHPASSSQADVAAAEQGDGYMNRWFLDPIFKGSYPQDMQDIYARNFTLPAAEEEDAAIIAEPIDLLGINNYSRVVAQADDSATNYLGIPANPADAEYTEMGWEVYPEGLYELLTRVHRDYGPIPLYITENGAAFPDKPGKDGTVDDPRRINYLQTYLQACHRAIEEGVPLKGYYVWSLMDNFEWSFGFSKRFGLIYVDYETQKRCLKNSAHWYKKVISRNGLED